ncbi:hypothetical protein ACFLWY_02935 [Chloroflexota bacterium]
MAVKQTSAGSSVMQDMLSKVEVDTFAVTTLSELKETRLEQAALKLLPETCSILVLAMEIHREVLAHSSPSKEMGTMSLRDLFAPHLDYVQSRILKASYDIARASHSQGLKALVLPATGCPTDGRFLKAMFSFKHAAQAAGLGTIGWNSLLITNNFGPRVRLGCVLTEASLEPTAGPAPSFDCSKCKVCIQKCPADALAIPAKEQPYSINKFACSVFRNAAGGCSECMRLCPQAN